jgi:iron complex transport system permease protein
MAFKRKLMMSAVLFMLMIAAVFPAMMSGRYEIQAGQIWSVIWSKITGASNLDVGRSQQVIIWKIRMPRLVLALTAGVALSISGTAYQGCFRNPLVEPYILGVSTGAACGAAAPSSFLIFSPKVNSPPSFSPWLRSA